MSNVSHNSSIKLNQLCKESKERVRYVKFCPSCNKKVHNEDIVKGYRYAEGKYIVLDQSDIDSITSDKDRTHSLYRIFLQTKRNLGSAHR